MDEIPKYSGRKFKEIIMEIYDLNTDNSMDKTTKTNEMYDLLMELNALHSYEMAMAEHNLRKKYNKLKESFEEYRKQIQGGLNKNG